MNTSVDLLNFHVCLHTKTQEDEEEEEEEEEEKNRRDKEKHKQNRNQKRQGDDNCPDATRRVHCSGNTYRLACPPPSDLRPFEDFRKLLRTFEDF